MFPQFWRTILLVRHQLRPGGGIYSTNQTPAARPSVAKSIFCGNTYGSDVAHIGGPYYDDGGNSFAEVCGEDCNENQLIDEFEILFGLSDDCDANGVPDECDVEGGFDCNMNGVPDACDLLGGDSADCDANGLPDECDEDCNGNGSPDICDVKSGLAPDCDGNGLPDECDIADGSLIDCNTDGLPDICGEDCNGTGLADECDIESGDSLDCDTNGVPDECDPDCDTNGIPDVCDIEQETFLIAIKTVCLMFASPLRTATRMASMTLVKLLTVMPPTTMATAFWTNASVLLTSMVIRL